MDAETHAQVDAPLPAQAHVKEVALVPLKVAAGGSDS